jgi:hypothetical protein
MPSTKLDLYLTQPKPLSILGEQKFLEGVEARQPSLDEAGAILAKARSQSSLVEEPTSGGLLEAWPSLEIPEKRRLLHGFLDHVSSFAAPTPAAAKPRPSASVRRSSCAATSSSGPPQTRTTSVHQLSAEARVVPVHRAGPAAPERDARA